MVSKRLICRLAEQAAAAESPDEALRKVRELRVEIDAFERQQVARALTAGGSLASVARALGVTRQSTHRRYRQLIAPVENGRPRPTPELRLAVEFARSEARDLAAPAIGSEHLLLGILRSSDHPAVLALNRLGVEYDITRNAVRNLSAADRRGDVRQALCEAVHTAQHDGCKQVGVEHVVLGTLRDPDSGANATLRVLGVTPAAVVAALARRTV